MGEKDPVLEQNKQEEIVLEDDQLLCLLTEEPKKAKGAELTLQSVIRMLNEEYGFEMTDMERDYNISYEDPESGKKKKMKLSLVVFEEGAAHEQENIIRICIVQTEKTKANDKKKGVAATLEQALGAVEACNFGLWTNGLEYHFSHKTEDSYGNGIWEDISDFPGLGQTLDDLEGDTYKVRNPAGDSLVRVFKRCRDYIYGNEGMKKTAFWELLYLIFCKTYDEKRRDICVENNETYRRKFWVGVREQNTEEGQAKVAQRIKKLFEELKQDPLFSEVFDGNEMIMLTDKGLAYVASELARYSFLDASVDVKGTAYETIVSNNFKQEGGQFFTPRNIIKCMVEMMDPSENDRIFDPACGSAGFLVVALEHVRKKIAKEIYPDLDGVLLQDKYNSREVNERVRAYAKQYIFGFDFDPDLKKAAKMNMVMAGDGHSNIFHVNSLAYPQWENKTEMANIQKSDAKQFGKCSR